MRYVGGKSRIAGAIAGMINAVPRWEITNCKNNSAVCNPFDLAYERNGGGGEYCFVSLFCGSCAVESKISGFSRKILNDRHEYLISMYHAIQCGWTPPDVVTPEQYQYIRQHRTDFPALAGFVGFGCSFGGKWFGGYARNAGGTNYAARSKRSLLKDMTTLMDAEFVCGDYRAVAIPPGAVIYADPPYKGATGYGGEKFNTVEFWAAMRLLADTGHHVFVSEQEAPPDALCIWEKPFTRTLDRNKNNQFTVMERLYYLPPLKGTSVP